MHLPNASDGSLDQQWKQLWRWERLREGYEMGYVFGLREGLSPVAQATRC